MQTEVKIHPTALIEKGAELGVGVVVGPYCVIGAQVKIGDRSFLQSHVVLDGIVEMGESNVFSPFAAIGGAPQDLSYKNEPTKVKIGNNNTFREAVSVHRGTIKDKQLTFIGNHNYFMGYSHVAHDCVVGNHNILVNNAAIAGHVELGNHIVIGGQSGVQQKVRIGDYAFVGGASAIRRDLPPYMAAKEFSQVTGPNLVGLKRQGFSEEDLRAARELYKMLYLGNRTTEKAVQEMEARFGESPFVKRFIDFIKSTKVGIQR